MKNILYYIWAVLVFGTFTALLGGIDELCIHLLLPFTFWAGMLMPMTIGNKENQKSL